MNQSLVKDLFTYKDGNLYWNDDRGTNKLKGKKAGYINKIKSKKAGSYQQRAVIGIKGKMHLAHRLIYLYHHGFLPEVIDHKDGNPLNNKIENLRECTQTQNCQNKMKVSDTPGAKGVSWHELNKKWYVRLRIDGIRRYFGSFDDLELASLVADEARAKYHGEFARNA